MGKTLIAIIFLIIGLAVGAFGALAVGGGAMAGFGIGTGLSAGICVTIDAASDLGVISDEQADQILNRAAENISGMAEIPEDQRAVNSRAACEEVMAKLKLTGSGS